MSRFLLCVVVSILFLTVGGVFDIPAEVGKSMTQLSYDRDKFQVMHVEIDWVKSFRLNWISYSCYAIALVAAGLGVFCVIAALARVLLCRLRKLRPFPK